MSAREIGGVTSLRSCRKVRRRGCGDGIGGVVSLRKVSWLWGWDWRGSITEEGY
jgi:hypothetical protein